MVNDKELIEGFNAGYIIEKHRPELAKQLVEGLDGMEVPFVEGFIAGNSQSLKERERTRSKTISKLKGFAKDKIPRPTKNHDRENKGFDIER